MLDVWNVHNKLKCWNKVKMLSSVKNVEKNMKLNILKSKRLEHYEMLRRGQRVETEMKKSFLFFRLSWVASVLSVWATQKKSLAVTLAVRLSLIFMKTKKAASKVKRLHSLVSRSGSSVWKAKKWTLYSSWSHFETFDKMKAVNPCGSHSGETGPFSVQTRNQ